MCAAPAHILSCSLLRYQAALICDIALLVALRSFAYTHTNIHSARVLFSSLFAHFAFARHHDADRSAIFASGWYHTLCALSPNVFSFEKLRAVSLHRSWKMYDDKNSAHAAFSMPSPFVCALSQTMLWSVCWLHIFMPWSEFSSFGDFKYSINGSYSLYGLQCSNHRIIHCSRKTHTEFKHCRLFSWRNSLSSFRFHNSHWIHSEFIHPAERVDRSSNAHI